MMHDGHDWSRVCHLSDFSALAALAKLGAEGIDALPEPLRALGLDALLRVGRNHLLQVFRWPDEPPADPSRPIDP